MLTVLVEDGNCVIQAVMSPGVSSAHASEMDLVMGAQTVIYGCVRKGGSSVGGMAKDLGRLQSSLYPRRIAECALSKVTAALV